MANKTLSQLRSENPPTSITGDELIYAVKSGDDTALTVDEIRGVPPSPRDLLFVKEATVPFFEVTPQNLRDFSEGFNANTGQFTRYTEGTLATFTVSGGQLAIENSSGAARNDIVVVGNDLVIPQAGCSIDVVSRSGTLSGYSNIGVGIAKDSNNFVFAGYDAVANIVRVQVKISGSNTFNASVSKVLSPPYKLGFSLVANSVCVYGDTGTGWEYLTGYSIPTATVNFKTTALTGWKRGFTVATPNNHTWVFDNFNGGCFGGVGIRDINPITLYNGNPSITSNTIRAVCTFVDAKGVGFQGTADINLTTYSISMVGVQFISRDGAKQNDVAGQILTDGTNYKLLITTWGNGFGGVLDLLYKDFSSDNISTGVRLLTGLTKVNVPTQLAGYGVYDPSLFLDGSTWRLAHTITKATSFVGDPFYTAVCQSSDLVTWTNPFDDRSTLKYEGTRVVVFEGGYYIMSGTTNKFRYYDKFVNYRGDISATVDGGTVTQPHPSIFKLGGDYYLITFDQERHPSITDSFTWGRMIVQKAVSPS